MTSPDRLPSHSLLMATGPTPPACTPVRPLPPFPTDDPGFHTPDSSQGIPPEQELFPDTPVSDPLSAAFRFRRLILSP